MGPRPCCRSATHATGECRALVVGSCAHTIPTLDRCCGCSVRAREVTRLATNEERAQMSTTAGPPPELRYRHPIRVRASARRAWRSRGFVAALVERNFRARYKKSLLGPLWALVVPLGYVLVFSVVFNGVTKVATGGVPYPLFSYVAL